MSEIFDQPIVEDQPLYSYHAFLFPFEWKHRGEKGRLLEEQVDLEPLKIAMKTGRDHWERRSSWNPPKSVVQYNEVAYFYDFVRPVLYDSGNEDTLQLHYYRKKSTAAPLEYLIELPNRIYRLEVDDIVVSFYDTGVGVVAFHLLNKRKEQSSPNDILMINGMGRRVYPPFLSSDTDLIGHQSFFEYADWETALYNTKTKSKEIPVCIRIKPKGTEPSIVTESYLQWINDQNLDQEPDLVRELLPAAVFQKMTLIPVLDDRMFVVCWYGNQAVVKDIQGEDKKVSKEGDHNYKTHEWWYKYVFVDSNYKTCQNDEMTRSLLEPVTNARWIGDGTLYGVNRYSFVALTSEISSSFFNTLICSHTQTMYYKVALLGLVQRASLLRFSEEVTAISRLPRNDKQIAQRIGSLYKQYIRFINRIYFREVTAQEQGIELYDTLQQQMRLPAQVEALDKEIQELHQYVLILDEEHRNEKLDLLTYFAALFVVPSFIGTYFGINGFNMKDYWQEVSAYSLILAALAIAVIRSSGKWRIFWLILTGLFTAYVIFVFPNMKFS